MKTKYLAFAGLAGLSAVVYYFRFRNKLKGNSTYEILKTQSALGEKHIRGVMKKSKLAL